MTAPLQSYVDALVRGETVQFRPHGQSMSGRIESGQLITVEPCTAPIVGDVVVCAIRGRIMVHLVKAQRGDCYLIGNNHGRINGWTGKIYGRVTKVEP
jgi:hypothetical protein